MFTYSATVVRVVDGDTLRLGERRVRLIGIDAPELDGALARVHGIDMRLPYQSDPTCRRRLP